MTKEELQRKMQETPLKVEPIGPRRTRGPRKLTPDELRRKMLEETPVKDEPIGSGVQQGKRLLTYADGTQVIFKPAAGEGARPPLPHSPTSIEAIMDSLTRREQHWFAGYVRRYGEAHVLRYWEGLRVQINYVRYYF